MDNGAPAAARTAPAELLASPVAARIAVQVHAWGVTGADVEHALHHAEQRPSRNAWQFTEPQRHQAVTCPLDLEYPAALAAESGYHWAYVVVRRAGS
jgi:hypothetical protein